MASLKNKTIKGFFWAAGTQACTTFLTMLFNIALARLLFPDDFGLVGMALIFTNLVTVMFSLGLGTAIIQKQDIGQDTYSTVFWINLMIGIAASIFVFSFSSFIGSYFNEVKVGSILKLMSINFILGSFSSVPIGLLSKRMEFKKQGISTILSMIIAYPFAVFCAFHGAGYWSIVYGNVLQTFFNSLFMWIASRWFPSFYFSLESIKSIFSFGIFKTLLGIFSYIIRNIDYFLIGKILGVEALGYYTIGVTLARMPIQKIRYIISYVAFPAFAQIQHNRAKFIDNFYKLSRLTMLIVLPLSLSLCLFANEIVHILYGSKWSNSIVVLQIIALFAVFRALEQQIQTMFMSLGNAKTVFFLFLIESIILFFLIFVGVEYGLKGVALAVSGSVLISILIKLLTFKKYTQLKVKKYFNELKIPFVVDLLIFLLFFFLKNRIDLISKSLLMVLPQIVIVLIVFFVADWFILRRTEKDEIKDFINNFLFNKETNHHLKTTS